MTRDELVQRARHVLEADPRVQAAWLAGSLGTGKADAYSDVDLLVALDSSDLAGFGGDAPGLLAEMATLVFWQQLPGGIPVWTAVSEEWLRFDLTALPKEAVLHRSRDQLRVLFDRAGLHDRLRAESPGFQPSAERVLDLAREFMRSLGLTPAVIGRGEYSVGAWGSGLLRDLLSRLLLEEARVAERGGALRLYEHLSPEQRDVLAGLPPTAATRDSLVEAQVAYARAFLPRARTLLESLGGTWPHELEHALRQHLRRQLDLEI
jgi:hypothetical protein